MIGMTVARQTGGDALADATGGKGATGRCDWLGLVGVDRWLGGVHLTDPATAWRWDPTLQRLGRRET